MSLLEENLILATTDEQTKWLNAVGSGKNIYQTWDYCSALQRSRNEKIQLLVARSRNAEIICTYYERSKDNIHYDICSPYGYGGLHFLGNPDEVQQLSRVIFRFFEDQGYVACFLMGQLKGSPEPDFVSPHRSTYMLDISDIGQTWKKMRKNYRNELNRYNKGRQYKLITEKSVLEEVFVNLYYSTLERVKASHSYYFKEETLRTLIRSELAVLVGVEINNTLHAIDLFLQKGDSAEYFLSAATETGRDFAKPLIWETVKLLNQRSVTKLHLGGGVSEDDSLSDFKRRFGAVPNRIPVWKKIIRLSKYEQLCARYRSDNERTEYFPAYWS